MLHPSVAYCVGGSLRVVQADEENEGEEDDWGAEGQEVRVTEVGSSQ